MEKQIMWNGKTFKPLKKFLTGAFLLGSFFFLFNYLDGADGIEAIKKSVRIWMEGFMNKDLAQGLSALIILPLPIYMVYAAVSGTYRICTCNMYINMFDSKQPGGVPIVGNSAYPNINRVLSYRESVLCGKSPDAGADLLIKSAKLDALVSGTYNCGPETMRTVSYIESKLSGMSSDRALNYLVNSL